MSASVNRYKYFCYLCAGLFVLLAARIQQLLVEQWDLAVSIQIEIDLVTLMDPGHMANQPAMRMKVSETGTAHGFEYRHAKTGPTGPEITEGACGQCPAWGSI